MSHSKEFFHNLAVDSARREGLPVDEYLRRFRGAIPRMQQEMENRQIDIKDVMSISEQDPLGGCRAEDCLLPDEVAEIVQGHRLPSDRVSHIKSCSDCSSLVGLLAQPKEEEQHLRLSVANHEAGPERDSFGVRLPGKAALSTGG